jgi:hypothetical protein
VIEHVGLIAGFAAEGGKCHQDVAIARVCRQFSLQDRKRFAARRPDEWRPWE